MLYIDLSEKYLIIVFQSSFLSFNRTNLSFDFRFTFGLIRMGNFKWNQHLLSSHKSPPVSEAG